MERSDSVAAHSIFFCEKCSSSEAQTIFPKLCSSLMRLDSAKIKVLENVRLTLHPNEQQEWIHPLEKEVP